jgi:hypothetical protein
VGLETLEGSFSPPLGAIASIKNFIYKLNIIGEGRNCKASSYTYVQKINRDHDRVLGTLSEKQSDDIPTFQFLKPMTRTLVRYQNFTSS